MLMFCLYASASIPTPTLAEATGDEQKHGKRKAAEKSTQNVDSKRSKTMADGSSNDNSSTGYVNVYVYVMAMLMLMFIYGMNMFMFIFTGVMPISTDLARI